MTKGYVTLQAGSHRHSDSGDIVVLVCHMILQYRMIRESSNFLGRGSSRSVIILPSFVAMDTVVVEI